MGQQHLIDMSGGAATDKRIASATTNRRKALHIKPTVRGGPKKRAPKHQTKRSPK